MFDVEQIANLSNLDSNTVRTFLPDILNSIREYTHKTFITNVIISGEISISDGKIIISSDIPTDFIVNSNIINRKLKVLNRVILEEAFPA